MNTGAIKNLSLGFLFVTISLILIDLNWTPRIDNGQPSTLIASPIDLVKTRDFMWYDCKDMKRIGGPSSYVKNAPNDLFRIDGAWFTCWDHKLALKPGNCLVLSFGVRDDFSFDQKINEMYSCRVFSFDPFEEAKFFTDIRLANNRLANSVEISVNEKWKFYRLGISHRNSQLDFTRLKTGDILNLTMILRLTGMEHREIDVLKMDIDGAEKDIINKFDINYLCKYVKQLMMETHGNFRFSDLVMLERCFLMFRRDTRFFEHKDITPTLGLLTEFQLPDGFNLNLKPFRNENFLAEYMFTNGELYFINKNFLS